MITETIRLALDPKKERKKDVRLGQSLSLESQPYISRRF